MSSDFISNLNRQDLLTFSKLIVHQSVFCNISIDREFACVVLWQAKDHSITLMLPLWLHPYFNTIVVGLCCVNELFYYITSVSLTGVVREHLDPAAAFFPEATMCDDHNHSYPSSKSGWIIHTNWRCAKKLMSMRWGLYFYHCTTASLQLGFETGSWWMQNFSIRLIEKSFDQQCSSA